MAASSKMPLLNKCCIIGLGLVGGSLGMALGRHNVVGERWGYDVDERSMEEARKRGAVDKTGPLLQVLKGADLVILALPVRKSMNMIRKIVPFLSRGTLVTDVGSTKKEVVAAMEKYLPSGVNGIGGHPMAGSEKSGITAADPLLLENAIYLITPTRRASPYALETLQELVRAIKAHPLVLEPEEHDRLVALVSHLPHLIAVSLVNAVRNSKESKELLLTLTGGGFRDTTRIALGEPSIWYDIFITNRYPLKEALELFQKELQSFLASLEKEKEEEVRQALEEARSFRCLLPYRGKGILPEAFELIIMLPDVPGVLGKITSLVGEAGLNISEIEILRIREEKGGSIRLGFNRVEDRDRALELLSARGYRCWKRG